MGRELSESVRDEGGVEQRAGLPEDPPCGPRPRHTRAFRQTGIRTANLHRLVHRLGPSQVEREFVKSRGVQTLFSEGHIQKNISRAGPLTRGEVYCLINSAISRQNQM